MPGFAPIVGAPFGVESDFDLSRPIDAVEGYAIRRAFAEHKLLVFRNQNLSQDEQARALGTLGDVLPAGREVGEVSVDGTLGSSALAFHSDLIFTEEPIKVLSLHAIDVAEGETVTRFANGIAAARHLSPALRDRLSQTPALALMSIVQSRRAIPVVIPDILPRAERPALIAHPATGEPILYVTEMQTVRLGGMYEADSDELLHLLFGLLYAPANIYEHRWRRGDLVIWDNLALQHGRPDLAGVARRRLQRACVADHDFAELCPDFNSSDPRVKALGRGEDYTADTATY
ncbi:TauD/TfdA dioxygenase family protein [Sphingomonas montanisoli]|nr:TauD/TfdA family dioxygenase [Sphingomonas montanisoli]